MGSRLPGRAVVPSRRKGADGGPRRAPASTDLPGGPAVARCSGSAVIVTGATGIAASDADEKPDGTRGGPPTGGTSKARKAGSITATGNGTTGNAAATGPRVTDQPSPAASGSDSIVETEPSRSENGSESDSGEARYCRER